jgi:hypothetical protein
MRDGGNKRNREGKEKRGRLIIEITKSAEIVWTAVPPDDLRKQIKTH